MDASSEPDVHRVVEELRLDHVVVEPLAGGPEPTETHRRLVAQVKKVEAETGIDVYVALVNRVGGREASGSSPADAFALRLRNELGGAPGVYVVKGGDTILQVNAWGTPFRGVDLSLLSYGAAYELAARWRAATGEEQGGQAAFVDAEAAVRSVPGLVTWTEEGHEREGGERETTLSESDLADLTAWGVATSHQADWRPNYGEASDRESALVANFLWAVGAFLVILLGLGPLLRRWPARLATPGDVPELADVRAAAERELDVLARALAQVASSSARADEDRWTRALVAQDVARRLAGSRKVADVVGAVTVAATGARDARIARSGRGKPYRGCFFDPRHGEAAGERAWQLGQGHVELPACAACLAAGRRGEVPEALLLPGRGGRGRPYYEGKSIWARTGYGSLTSTYAADVTESRA